jgi:hypothetical protein
MTNLSPQAQAIINAAYALPLINGQPNLAAALRSLVDSVVPEETEAPKAVFDCEPRPSYNFKTGKCDGPLRHDHSAYLRRSYDQQDLNLRWEQRQQTRAMMLATIVELEQM